MQYGKGEGAESFDFADGSYKRQHDLKELGNSTHLKHLDDDGFRMESKSAAVTNNVAANGQQLLQSGKQ